MHATVEVRNVRSVGGDTVVVEFESPADFEAEPGQFVRLTDTVDGEEMARFYTLSSPDVEGTFEVTVGIEPEEGAGFSEHLAGLSAGKTVDLDGPFGDQYYEGEPRAVVLAGGPGVGPAVAIAERALAEGNEAAVVYRDDEPAHLDRLDALRAAGATVDVVEGSVADPVAAALTLADGEQVFVYGFADFCDDARAAIEAVGGDPAAAKVESFG